MLRRARIAPAVFALFVGGLLWVGWTSRTSASSFHRVFDRSYLFLIGNDPAIRCWEEVRDGTSSFQAFIGARRCYDFLPPRLYDGVYVDEFEGHRFVPQDMATGQRHHQPRNLLEIDEHSDLRASPQLSRLNRNGDQRNRIWRVRFVGRETRRPSSYRHLGANSQLILMDRLISADIQATYEGYLPETLDPRTISSGNRR